MRVLLQEIINPKKCINNSLFRECSMQIFFIITKQLTNSKNERKIQALCVGIFYYFKRFFAFSVFRKLCCELTISTIKFLAKKRLIGHFFHYKVINNLDFHSSSLTLEVRYIYFSYLKTSKVPYFVNSTLGL